MERRTTLERIKARSRLRCLADGCRRIDGTSRAGVGNNTGSGTGNNSNIDDSDENNYTIRNNSIHCRNDRMRIPYSGFSARAGPEPPAPPLQPTPAMACDPHTDPQILWWIARYKPSLRRWIIANPAADAELLEFISQVGGPYVKQSLQILLDSMDENADR